MKWLIWNNHTKLLTKHVLGWFCIAAGIIMLITPGQGILTILIGVYLLADHIPVIGRFKNWLQHRFPKTADYVHRKSEKLKTLFHKEHPEGNPKPLEQSENIISEGNRDVRNDSIRINNEPIKKT